VVDALEHDDELIVVGDGRQDYAADVVESFQPANIVYIEASLEGSCFGNAQRDAGSAIARGDFLCWLDDDDQHLPGALDAIRWAIGNDRTHAHIFKATWGPGHHWHGTLWADKEVREQNIATCMTVLPSRPYTRSWMDSNHLGIVSDFGFLSAAIGECDGIKWHDAVVATVRPGPC
jgi:glycosyltransferase involved in cell wall biosynthesis